MKKYIFICFTMFAFLITTNAQQFRIGASYGVLGYFGDVSYQTVQMQYLQQGWGLNLERVGANGVNFRLNRTVGNISYNDRTFDINGDQLTDNPAYARSLNFKTDIEDVSLNVIFNLPSKNGVNTFFRPYAGFGIGASKFTVFGDLLSVNGERYYYWTDGNIYDRDEDLENPYNNIEAEQIAQDGDFETNLSQLQTNAESYRQFAFNLPVTLGFDVRLSSKWNLNLETSLKMTNTDFLDDVSGAYPNIVAEDDPFLAYASNPNNDASQIRGNEIEENDWFYYSNVGLTYTFGQATQKVLKTKKIKTPKLKVNTSNTNLGNTNSATKGGLFGDLKAYNAERRRLRNLRKNNLTNTGVINVNDKITEKRVKVVQKNIAEKKGLFQKLRTYNEERRMLKDMRKSNVKVEQTDGSILIKEGNITTDDGRTKVIISKNNIDDSKVKIKEADGSLFIKEGEIGVDDGKTKLFSTKKIDKAIKEKLLNNAEKMTERTDVELSKPVEVEIKKPKLDRIREALEKEVVENAKTVKIIKEIVKEDGTVEIIEEEATINGNNTIGWLEEKLSQFGETATRIVKETKEKITNTTNTTNTTFKQSEPKVFNDYKTEVFENTTATNSTPIINETAPIVYETEPVNSNTYYTTPTYSNLEYNRFDLPSRTVAVFFKSGSSTIENEFKSQIDNVIVAYLRDNANLKIELRGHADSSGNANWNMILSEKRANKVKDYIIESMGENFDTSRLTVKVFGEGETKNINPDENNRVVEMLWFK